MGKSILKFDIFETMGSVDEVQSEILENVSYISDILGEPSINKRIYTGGSFIYTLSWNIGFNISSDNDVSTLSDFYPVMKEISELRSAKDRMDKLDFVIRITDKIVLTIYPKAKTKDSYNFILGQDWREVKINKVDIIRFFRNKGVDILSIKEVDELESCSVLIELNSSEYSPEFIRLLSEEINRSLDSGDIDRDIEVSGGKSISIYPVSEKTYVVIG